MGHALSDNRNDLIVNARFSQADGYVEHEAAKAMINDARQTHGMPETANITLGADKGYVGAKEFIQALQEMNVLLHVAQNKSARQSALPAAIAGSQGYAISR